METEEARQLLIKYNAGECTDAEKALVESSFLAYNEHEIDISPEKIEEIGEQIYSELPIAEHEVKKISLWRGVAAIAAITLLSIGSWHIFDRFIQQPEKTIVQDVGPGSNRATITFGNGKTINLNGSKNGVVIGGKDLTYLDGSTITERDRGSSLQTLSTPKGGQYHIVPVAVGPLLVAVIDVTSVVGAPGESP